MATSQQVGADRPSNGVNPPPATNHLLPANYRLLPTVNALGLLLAAVWLRCCLLGNVPGCNGDEAWYGVQAWRAVHGEPFCWQTPTGNPLNGFFLGPLALLHVWFAPSIALLRSVAAGGPVRRPWTAAENAHGLRRPADPVCSTGRCKVTTLLSREPMNVVTTAAIVAFGPVSQDSWGEQEYGPRFAS